MIKPNFKFLNFYFKSFHQCIHMRSNHFHFANYSRLKIDSNQVLKKLSKTGRINEVRKLFDKMPERDEFTWNTLIAAYAASEKLTEAMKLFKETPIKSSITWNSLILGYCQHGMKTEAFDLSSTWDGN
ncbi:hypothetical protein like AT3G61170 [Hibiscus trionum]|uniref:Pentatricopeptide repeat-containing protein n=1 Tax=Hibiscus trionum TaxID=183268 RepID=A0A9W7MTH1_HIBTR|nr:hypothetical protein like AT3G61170 [Hibiscus trionum]